MSRYLAVRGMHSAFDDRGSLTTIVGHMREVRARDDEQHIRSGPAVGPMLPDPIDRGLMSERRVRCAQRTDRQSIPAELEAVMAHAEQAPSLGAAADALHPDAVELPGAITLA